MMSRDTNRTQGPIPELLYRGSRLAALGMALALLLTACGHEGNGPLGVFSPTDEPSPALLPMVEIIPAPASRSVSDYAVLHNSLLDQYTGYYPTPDAAVMMLPSNLANAISIYQACTREKATALADPALDTFYTDYPTPESFLQETTATLYPKIAMKLDEAVKAGDMSKETAAGSLSVIQAMMHLEPYEQPLADLAESVDNNGTEFAKEAVGTLLGSSSWWPDHLAPTPVIQGGDKYVPPWVIESLIGMFMDYLGSLYPIPGYGYFTSFLVAVAANTEPGDFPHWGVHYKSGWP